MREHLLGLRGEAFVEESPDPLAQTQANRVFDAEFVEEVVERGVPGASARPTLVRRMMRRA